MIRTRKLLFILHLPPPVHGSSIIGGYIKESTLLHDTFNTSYINLGTSRSIDEIGKNGRLKVLVYFKILGSVFKQMVVYRPNMVYLAMTAKGIGFYKDALVGLIIKLFGKQLVIHFHNKGVRDNQNKVLDHVLYKLIFKNSKIILLSKYLYPDIKKYVREADVYYCPNGIPELSLDQYKRPIKKSSVQLLFLSNLIESKGVFVLLEALSILKSKAIKFHCNFVGGEGDVSESDFEKKVQDLQLDNLVTYLGPKFGNEKAAIFRQSDVFVHPSYSDCFPLVLLEASQYRLPLVSTDEGAIPEIIENERNGYVIPKKNKDVLAAKLEMLILDENKRRIMGEAAYNKYQMNYTLLIFESKMRSILSAIN